MWIIISFAHQILCKNHSATTFPHKKNRAHKRSRLEIFNKPNYSELCCTLSLIITEFYYHTVMETKKSPGVNRQWFSIIGRIIHRLLRFLWLLCTPGNVWRLDYKKYEVCILHDSTPRDIFRNDVYGTDKPTEDKGLSHRKLKLSLVILTLFSSTLMTWLGYFKTRIENHQTNKNHEKGRS